MGCVEWLGGVEGLHSHLFIAFGRIPLLELFCIVLVCKISHENMVYLHLDRPFRCERVQETRFCKNLRADSKKYKTHQRPHLYKNKT